MIGCDREKDAFVRKEYPVSSLGFRLASGHNGIQAAVAQMGEKLTTIRFRDANVDIVMGLEKRFQDVSQRAAR